MQLTRPRWARLRRGGESPWRVAWTLCALGATFTALLALLLHQVATPWQSTVVLTAVSHQLMWSAPLGVAFAVLARRWGTSATAGIATLLAIAFQLPAQVALNPGAEGPEMVVLQANLEVGGADPTTLTDLVRGRRVDILATEELTYSEEQALVAAGLPALLPHRYTAPLPDGGGGLGIWSRYPLSDTHNLPGYELGVLTAHVATTSGPVTFVAVHLLPPYPYPTHLWQTEIARLRELITGLPGTAPVVVAGDFNATTDHAQFRALLDDGYGDAAEESGAGYLPTYPSDRWFGPLIGIDHVLTRGSAVAASADTLELPGSDHRALLVNLVLTR